MILTSEALLLGKEHELIETGSGLCVVITVTRTKFALQRRIARTVIIATGRSPPRSPVGAERQQRGWLMKRCKSHSDLCEGTAATLRKVSRKIIPLTCSLP